MGKIRSVHPSLFTDEAFVSCSPLARILIIGLWTEADDQGIFEWKPITLRMRLLPVDDSNLNELLNELVSYDVVKKFEHEGKSFGAIRNFCKFQKPRWPRYTHFLPAELRNYVSLTDKNTDKSPVKDNELRQNSEKGSVKQESIRHKSSRVESSRVESSKEKTNTMRESDDSLRSLRGWFDEIMWTTVPSEKKRGKEATWKAIQKLKPDKVVRDEIITYFRGYNQVRQTYDDAGVFFAEMQDPARVIQNKRFKDYLIPCTRDSKGEFLGVTYTVKGAYERAKANGEINIRYQGRNNV